MESGEDPPTRAWRDPGLVVGYDGSSESRRALRWALIDARMRHCVVALWDVWSPPPSLVIDRVSADLLGRRESHVLDEGIRSGSRWEPGVPMRKVLIRGFPVTELSGASRDAELLVVGSVGHGALDSLLLGSVSAGVAAHAACPVVIVRPPPPRPAHSPIAVGFDGSEPALAALRLAFAEARLRGAEVSIVHAEPGFPAAGRGTLRDDDPEAVTGAPDRVLASALAELSAEHPSVKHRTEFVSEHPRTALMNAAGRARMLVVGSRGAGGLRGLVLGSVSQHLVRHSPCTTIVTHTPRDSRS